MARVSEARYGRWLTVISTERMLWTLGGFEEETRFTAHGRRISGDSKEVAIHRVTTAWLLKALDRCPPP